MTEIEDSFYPIDDWFSYENILNYNDNGCHWIVFEKCQLKNDIAQFKKGTLFTFIRLNEHGVVGLNIYDKNHPNICEAPGYNYIGRWCIKVEDIEYNCLFGYWGLCYGRELKLNKSGFKATRCKAHEKTPKLSNNEFIDKIKLDFKNNTLDINKFCLQFTIKVVLLPESIKTKYLESELIRGNISESDYNDTISRRCDFRFDVQCPESCT